VIGAAKEGIETLATLRTYRVAVLPAVREELADWRRVAAEIPDPALRQAATTALTAKAANVEATAVLATLAPPEFRPTAMRASAALQIAIDYLDVLGEKDVPDPLQDGLCLHRALGAALTPGAGPESWYLHHPRGEDGGYLNRLVASCQQSACELPSQSALLPAARRAAERCGEGQSYTHAAAHDAASALEAWASSLAAPSEFRWWEVAAGASSSVAAHALLALAADPAAASDEAEAVDAAYFPAIGALTVILDDLIDRDEDLAGGEHSYLGYYAGPGEAAERLRLIAEAARERTGRLRNAGRHRAILAGVLAYYLASPQAGAALPRPARRRLARSAGPAARPLTAVLRLSR
jgi:tetraprenyl-beta-curcumene synthase